MKKKRENEETSADEPEEPFTVLFVMNEESDKAEIRVVKTGIQDDKFISVESGLQAGETVITGPYEIVAKKLKNGDKVALKKDDDNEDEDKAKEE
jgi:HlyD family secretion protein